MPVITLADGNTKTFLHPMTLLEVANTISSGLGKAALAGKVNDKLVDTSHLIDYDAKVLIITNKDPEGLEIIRHSTAHLLAHAVKQLFPMAQVTIGPVIEDGFYYDFFYEPGFSLEDLTKIEQRMHEISRLNIAITRKEMSRQQAIAFYKNLGETYKVKIIEDLPDTETLSFYEQQDFTDLCRGPHVPSTGHLKHFKLMKLAGSYWRGDAKNTALQRIYGTAWPSQQQIEDYLKQLEEAEKRDHRRLATKMELFHIQEEAPGMIFWHENGWIIYRIIENYIRNQLMLQDYKEVHTPQLVDQSLWEQSGHLGKFGEVMFSTETENRTYAIKPMNCPCHVQIFNQGLKSYRDLPLRLAEFGSCHRNEPSGTLHGLMRVRNFTQDDGHIFCTEEQIQGEVAHFIENLFAVYSDFGFNDILIKLSTRPEERVGTDAVWDKAEQALKAALDAKKLPWELQPGEGAFYGPKIEFSLRDCLGRVWQCGTIQVDFSMPERLGAHYVDSDGNRKPPVMLHRAILGSLERFIGILLEQYAGHLPLWLAPVQVVVMAIADRHHDYAKLVAEKLKQIAIRVKLDLRNEKIGFKIREHVLKRVPYQIVVGDKECEQQTVAVRMANDKQDVLSLVDFIKLIGQDNQPPGGKTY